MNEIVACEPCDAKFHQSFLSTHVEAYHVELRNEEMIVLSCISCSYSVSALQKNSIIQHCLVTGHEVENVKIQFNSYLFTEQKRIGQVLQIGLSIITNNIRDSSFNKPEHEKYQREKWTIKEKSDQEKFLEHKSENLLKNTIKDEMKKKSISATKREPHSALSYWEIDSMLKTNLKGDEQMLEPVESNMKELVSWNNQKQEKTQMKKCLAVDFSDSEEDSESEEQNQDTPLEDENDEDKILDNIFHKETSLENKKDEFWLPEDNKGRGQIIKEKAKTSENKKKSLHYDQFSTNHGILRHQSISQSNKLNVTRPFSTESKNLKETFLCDDCDGTFASSQTLTNHLRKHTAPLKNNDEIKSFDRLISQNYHQLPSFAPKCTENIPRHVNTIHKKVTDMIPGSILECKSCDYVSTIGLTYTITLMKIVSHTLSHLPEFIYFRCRFCSLETKGRRLAIFHLKRNHSEKLTRKEIIATDDDRILLREMMRKLFPFFSYSNESADLFAYS